MKITVWVKVSARKNVVERISDKEYKVYVSEPPIEGRANEKVIKLLSEYFNTQKSAIVLISGKTSKRKIFNIEI